jgi:flagellar hook-length control protein FliK
MDSIVQSMRMQYRDGIGTAVITLDPEFLGGVAISIHVANGAVTATLQADNPQVRAWLEANEPMLRQGLETQGLTLDRLVVAKEAPRDEAPSADDHRRQQQPEPEEKPRPRRHETATFEVIV